MAKDQQHGGRLKPDKYPRDRDLLDKALTAMREKLRCQGFTVDGVTDMHALYVNELDDTHLAKKPDGYRGYAYVGQTVLSTDERALEHELGPEYPWKKKPNHSRQAHNHFRRPAPELLPPKFRKRPLCRSSALRAKRDLRLYFNSKGYEVEGGKDLLKTK
jgi:hypothetical protein